jgi:hypothetical protein
MTDEEWEQIKPLAEAESRARINYESAGMQNQAKDPRERIEQSANYVRLTIEWREAKLALARALRDLNIENSGI